MEAVVYAVVAEEGGGVGQSLSNEVKRLSKRGVFHSSSSHSGRFRKMLGQSGILKVLFVRGKRGGITRAG